MQCLIIAAGQGTRLRSLAPSKPLAEVHGRPLIGHVVRAAKAGGATALLVVTGYEAGTDRDDASGAGGRDRRADRTGPQSRLDLRPNGLSVLAAAPQLEDEFLLLMSDHLFDPAIVAGMLAARPARRGRAHPRRRLRPGQPAARHR